MTSKVTPPNALELYQRYAPKEQSTFEGQVPCNLSDIYADIARRETTSPQLPTLMTDYGMSLLHFAIRKSYLTMAWDLIREGLPMDAVTTKTHTYTFLSETRELPAKSTPFDYALKMKKLSFGILLELNGGISPLLESGDETCKRSHAEVTVSITKRRALIQENSTLPAPCSHLIADYSLPIF